MPERGGPLVLLIGRDGDTLDELRRILRSEGHRVLAADSAARALEEAQCEAPDLVVFDARLADTDEWTRLEAIESLRDVRVICCCPHPSGEGKAVTSPFGSCVDYVSHPLVAAEVRARVRSGLELARLRRAVQRSESVSRELVSMLAHDLRTPLSSIILNLELLGSGVELTEGAEEDLAYALFSARSLAGIISMMQDVARLEAGEIALEPVETLLTAVVREAVARAGGPMTAREVKVEADVEIVARCDREMTRRVIEELRHGASAVTPEGSFVRVRILRRGDWARVEVTDGGATIPEELRAKTLEKEGMLEVRRLHRPYSRGLGPVFCRLAVEAQRGRIGVSADDGAAAERGNVFWFELPAVPVRPHS